MKHLEYWDNAYANKNGVLYPSQFAAFCAGELDSESTIVDCGCGNGRDSLFFALYGHTVIGMDGSVSAINQCQNLQSQHPTLSLQFEQIDIDNKNAVIEFAQNLHILNKPITLYSRFFLHAIDEVAESVFYELCDKVSPIKSKLYLEFRTTQDLQREKIWDNHFRRFVDPKIVMKNLEQLGFDIEYQIEGLGFAKFKNEDAHVCRIIATKNYEN